MSEQRYNPDNKDYEGISAGGFMIPTVGMLRFVERGVPTENEHVLKKVRVLQQYQWSNTLSNYGWFDVPLMETQP